MKRQSLLLSLIILAAVVFSACGGGGSYQNITSAELNEMLENEDFLLINVHTPYVGEIPGTDLFIPHNEIEQNLSQLPQDKGAKMVVYCRIDTMNVTAAETLVELGYTNVWSLEDGMVDWQMQGYQIIMN